LQGRLRSGRSLIRRIALAGAASAATRTAAAGHVVNWRCALSDHNRDGLGNKQQDGEQTCNHMSTIRPDGPCSEGECDGARHFDLLGMPLGV
jgi:hypothetical protein